MADFDATAAKIYPWLKNLARKYCYNKEDAEDLASDTILKLLINKDKFDNEKSIKPWCLAIMQNTYINNHNRQMLVQFVESEDEPYHPHTPHDCLSAKNLLFQIIKLRKTSCSIEPLVLYAEGYSYSEISNSLHIPEGTVRSRINFGRNLIRKYIE